MKVVFVTANWLPEATGGTEQVVAALAAHLQQHGVDVSAISGSDAPFEQGEGRTTTHLGVTVHRLTRRGDEHDGQGFLRPRLLARVHELLRQQRPDIVHVHSFAGLGVGITPICRELGIRVVVTFHDLWVTCARYFRHPAGGVSCPAGVDRSPCVTCVNDTLRTDPAIVEQRLGERDRLLRAEVALASHCTAPSATAARYVMECLPYDGPIEVVPHGLLRPVDPGHRAPGWQPDTPLRIGTYGGLVAEKGVQELAQAVAGLACELHLTGPFHRPEFLDTIRTIAAQNGTRLVLRGGYALGDRHPARDLHLAVFPSKCQETYGLVVDEALAHGVPAVLSDQGAFAERADAKGIVVTPLPKLANVLRELLRSPARLAALRAAIPVELPTIAVSAQRHLELYSRLR